MTFCDSIKNLLSRYLCINGTRTILSSEIKKLAFFSVLEWSNIDGYPAPFVPNPDNDMDTFYFEGKYAFHRNRNVLLLVLGGKIYNLR